MGRIVLLDDEPRLLRTLQRILELEGHDVVAGEHFGAVDAELVPGGYDLLITDIVMPGFTGVEVLQQLVERGCREPIVLVTGEPNVETAAEAVRLGAFDYLTKPVTKSDLLAVVARALRHGRLLRERNRARRAEMVAARALSQILERCGDGGEPEALAGEIAGIARRALDALSTVARSRDAE